MKDSVILKNSREKSLLRHHPWVFSGALAKIIGNPQAGETVDILSSKGKWLARGAYSPCSQIRIRVWSFNPDEEITAEFFYSRLKLAFDSRRFLIKNHNLNAYRLVNAESDRIPGLIVDRYGDFLVCQFLSAGSEHWKQEILSALKSLMPRALGIYERSDADVREKEGLKTCTGLLFGKEAPELVEIRENELYFLVDIRKGHKTGFYLDQRDNRAEFAAYAENAEVLNCFSYTGGFGIYALKYGATRLTNVDSSAEALTLCQHNIDINGLDGSRSENAEGDVFQILRRYRDSRQNFDAIVLDPPKFVESAGQLERAARGYKDINLLAFKLLRPGGVLFTFSCSGLMSPELFQKIVADAALDAECEAQIIRRLGQASDHPLSLNFPEGHYLKGLVCRIVP